MSYTTRKANVIFRHGGIAVLICTAKGRSFSVVIDSVDLPKVRPFFWWIMPSKKKFYVRTTINYRCILMHRFILGDHAQRIVDHFNGRGTDNRRTNLRAATDSQNQANRRTKQGKFKGVFLKRPGQYFACIKYNRKPIHLGSFRDPVIAAKAYDAKARELFGEFASLNFPEAM